MEKQDFYLQSMACIVSHIRRRVFLHYVILAEGFIIHILVHVSAFRI